MKMGDRSNKLSGPQLREKLIRFINELNDDQLRDLAETLDVLCTLENPDQLEEYLASKGVG